MKGAFTNNAVRLFHFRGDCSVAPAFPGKHKAERKRPVTLWFLTPQQRALYPSLLTGGKTNMRLSCGVRAALCSNRFVLFQQESRGTARVLRRMGQSLLHV